ncbi:uncharacterized protein EV154DRAFT_607914 [Mucor mucedo]|uniref:RING-type domain-containing protein n=1 Tax=Mucor saturninus TaxID=64648 RepID=A0A8H7V7U0_9FUNG|nr:uncharacterized protein EV154DRAFT_607914 [Mucor mucedo]KAG2208732.1 hypothetical protein INT47_007831 [Mucor saturninus]KAI7867630.1 hypothetical protein EV154DRAFT_607914 [Mucor mucedo]
MPRHSKNNTASSVFTYHESHTLEYGTKRQRLGRDSYKNYDACFLCLQTARDPVCCGQGHLACQECMYESILQQKQSIAHQQRTLDQQTQEKQAQKQLSDLEAQRVILDTFDKTQNSMLGNRQVPVDSKKRKRLEEKEDEEKRTLNEQAIDETALQLKQEKEEAAKPKIGSFWVPSVTPAADASALKPVKTQVLCSAVEKAHPLSIKSLITVKFQKEEGTKKDGNVCPACLKTLTNASKLSVLRNCGHVMCNGCIDKFVKKSKTCYVCEQKTKTKDIIDMSPEGTGFASASTKAVAEKFNLCFQ